MKYAETQAERKFKLNLASKIVETEKVIEESKATDQFKDLQTRFIKLMETVTALSTDVKALAAKIAIHDEKMTKMEDAPAEQPVVATPNTSNLTNIAYDSMSFGDFNEKAKEITS